LALSIQLKNLFSRRQAQVQETILEPLPLPTQDTQEVQEIAAPPSPPRQVSPFMDELVDLDDRFFRLSALIQQKLPAVRYSTTKLRLYEVRGRFIELEETVSDIKNNEERLSTERLILLVSLLSVSAVAASALLRMVGIG
jgi:hypothetical protein